MQISHRRETRSDARALALDSLLVIGRDMRPGHLVIRDTLAAHGDLDPQERRFYRKLTEGCLETRLRLDYVLDRFSSTKTERMKPVIREILRLAVYQILFLSQVPDSAAVNEAVKQAVRRGFSGLRGYVNGVLRAVARGKNTIKWPEKEADPIRYISVMYSIPEPLVRWWCTQLGTEQTERICGAFQKESPLTVRLRVPDARQEPAAGQRSGSGIAETDSEASAAYAELEQELRTSGVGVRPAPYLPYARYLEDVSELTSLQAFRTGRIAVQDVSSMLAVEAAGIRPGDTVLDLAAAPGGKSLLAADRLQGSGRVISRDVSERKNALIRENAARLHLEQMMHIQVWDATVPDESLLDAADVVIADLPCSGLGVIGRKPDIRYHASDEKTESLVQLQRQILANAVRYCRPGGTLLYSTCTFDPRENEENVAWLLEHTEMRPDPVAPYLPPELAAEAGDACCLQLYPGIHPCDGFFFARFKRS